MLRSDRQSTNMENVYLYNLTLKKATAITHAVHGNFSGAAPPEIVVSRKRVLELLKFEVNKLRSVLTVELFDVRSMIAYRAPGGYKDYLVICSDTGKMVVLDYNPGRNIFVKVHEEELGGCGRRLPGQFIASDPKGQSIMIGALEAQKSVYIFKETLPDSFSFCPVLKSNNPNHVVYDVVGIDKGAGNPMYACLEKERVANSNGFCMDVKQKLTLYEADNQRRILVKKMDKPLAKTGNLLIAVPGGECGPGGVLVCSENYVTYKSFTDEIEAKCFIPRRNCDISNSELGVIYSCCATHQKESIFFALLQTEQGDVLKLTLDSHDDSVEIKLKYFDTVPHATAMCILKTGLLFVASEFGNHHLYKIVRLGVGDNEPEFSSKMSQDEWSTFVYTPRRLKNLMLVDELESISPLMCCDLIDFTREGKPQLCMACGIGPNSSLQFYSRGVEVTEMVVSDFSPLIKNLGEIPNAIWAIKRKVEDIYDTYVILSFQSYLLVFSNGQSIEEAKDTDFQKDSKTLACAQIAGSSLVQVLSLKVRQIKDDKRVDWKTPDGTCVTKCSIGHRKVVISLNAGELVYFELDNTGQLNMCPLADDSEEMNVTVTCLAFIPESKFLVVGLENSTMRIVSFERCHNTTKFYVGNIIESAKVEQLREIFTKFGEVKECDIEGNYAFVVMSTDEEADKAVKGTNSTQFMGQNLVVDRFVTIHTVSEESLCDRKSHTMSVLKVLEEDCKNLYLFVGLEDGCLLKYSVNNKDGTIVHQKEYYIGMKPVELYKITLRKKEALIAVSDHSYLICYEDNCFHVAPLIYDVPLNYISSYSSELCPEGVVAISGNTLRILTLPKFGGYGHSLTVPLDYTPHKFVVDPERRFLFVIQSDRNAYSESKKLELKSKFIEKIRRSSRKVGCGGLTVEEAKLILNDLPESIFGAPRAGPGCWGSNFAVFNVATRKITTFPLEQNETTLSICLMRFPSRSEMLFLLIGIAKDLQMYPTPHCSQGVIYSCIVSKTETCLKLYHKTYVEEAPTSMCFFQGRAIISVGKIVRMYEMGKEKLLKKCENREIPGRIMNVFAQGQYIAVVCEREGFFFGIYDEDKNRIIFYAKYPYPRCIVTACQVDSLTLVAADVVGNICVISAPKAPPKNKNHDPHLALINGTYDRYLTADRIANFNVGERVMSVQKVIYYRSPSRPRKKSCALMYTTTSGVLGILLPFRSHQDYFTLKRLELLMRSKNQILFGTDPRSLRESLNIVDGDLCELFNLLDKSGRESVANWVEKVPSDILKMLENMRDLHSS